MLNCGKIKQIFNRNNWLAVLSINSRYLKGKWQLVIIQLQRSVIRIVNICDWIVYIFTEKPCKHINCKDAVISPRKTDVVDICNILFDMGRIELEISAIYI